MMTLILTEDEPFLQKMLSVSLEELGYTVITANNGVEALAKIQTEKPDLLLLDILMPKLDGFGVLEQLRKDKNPLPVFVLSNLGQTADVAKCMRLGAKEYFVKSDMEPGDLVAKIQKHLGK